MFTITGPCNCQPAILPVRSGQGTCEAMRAHTLHAKIKMTYSIWCIDCIVTPIL